MNKSRCVPAKVLSQTQSAQCEKTQLQKTFGTTKDNVSNTTSASKQWSIDYELFRALSQVFQLGSTNTVN